MSRLLSQAEVDALLVSFDSEADSPNLAEETLYDLRAPLVLAGERLALVQAACEKISAPVGDAMTLLLIAERPVKASFVNISQQPAGTVLGTLAPGESLGLILDENEEPVGGICFQPELGLSIADRAQGGDGGVPEGARPLSLVERRLLGEAASRMTRFLDSHTVLHPIASGGLERDTVFGRLAQRGGMLAAAQYRLTTPSGDATCRLLLTPVLLNRLLAEPPRQQPGDVPAELRGALAQVPVQVEPVIHGGTLKVGDLSRLEPGNVLQLDIREGEGLALRFNGELLALGELTRQGNERIFEVSALLGERSAPQEKAS